METLLLTDQRPKQTLIRLPVRVPVGHVLPEGTPVEQAFNIIVEAGIRWHPEWSEPKITVNAWRCLPMGDVLGAAGTDVADLYGLLLPPEVARLTMLHGADYDPKFDVMLKPLGLTPPRAPQPLSAFILPEQTPRRVH